MNQPLSGQSYFDRVVAELRHFEELVEAVIKLYGGVQLAHDVYLLGRGDKTRSVAGGGSKHKIRMPEGKKYPCALGAITHGNEVAGLSAMNAFLEALSLHEVILDYPIVVMLGNRKAALEGKRYVESDLNRSFAMDPADRAGGCYEHSRAEELEDVLKDVAFYFDLHQTIGSSPKGFFIFSYSQTCYHFARRVLPYQEIVTYWTGNYTTEGICSDQFVRRKGGVGITLELGSKGFDNYQAAIGFQALLATQGYVRRYLIQGLSPDLPLHWSHQQGQVYTWKSVVRYPQTGMVKPNLEFGNFAEVKKGDILAEVSDGTILAPESGLALFPNRIFSEVGTTKRPHELMRILRPVSEDEFPKDLL